MATPRRATMAIWLARIGWVCVLAFGVGIIGDVRRTSLALTAPGIEQPGLLAQSATTMMIAASMLWWLVGTASVVFPSTVTLTLGRIVVPLSLPLSLWALIVTDGSTDAAITLIAGLVATLALCSGDVGAAYVAASAYGAERRSLLRPPPVYLLLALVNWAFAAGCVVAALEFTRRGSLITGSLASIAAFVVLWWGRVRWHRLARRWLVIVPAGLVVHDHLVLAETLMLNRRKVIGVGLADNASDAFDLSGNTPGRRVEIHTAQMETVRLAATPGNPTGRAVHAQAMLVAPTRPGEFLRQAHQGRLPTGRVSPAASGDAAHADRGTDAPDQRH